MASKSNRRNAILLVAGGLLYGGQARTEPLLPTRIRLRRVCTIVTLPIGESDSPSPVAIPIPDKSLHVTPSRLVTRRDLRLQARPRRSGDRLHTDLLDVQARSRSPGTRAGRCGFVVSSWSKKSPYLWIERIPRSRAGVARGVDVEIATIEHLYGLALGQNPDAEFCLSGFGHKCGTRRGDYPHPKLLQRTK